MRCRPDAYGDVSRQGSTRDTCPLATAEAAGFATLSDIASKVEERNALPDARPHSFHRCPRKRDEDVEAGLYAWPGFFGTSAYLDYRRQMALRVQF